MNPPTESTNQDLTSPRQVLEQTLAGLVAILSPEEIEWYANNLNRFTEHVRAHLRIPGIERIIVAQQFVRDNCGDEKLTMKATADHVGMSLFYFCKVFKQVTKLNFVTFVQRCRVEKAKQLLLDPMSNVSQAAYGAGFHSLTHFNRVFKMHTRISPSEYRANNNVDFTQKIQQARTMLESTDKQVKDIAQELGFSVGRFRDVFVAVVGITPGAYQQKNRPSVRAAA